MPEQEPGQVETKEAIAVLHEYSIRFYEIQNDDFRNLDTKSSNLITFIGIFIGVFGLLGLESLMRLSEINKYLEIVEIVILIISFAFYLKAIWCALKCLEIRTIESIPSPEDIKQWFLEKTEDKSEERVRKLLFEKFKIPGDSIRKQNGEKADSIKKGNYYAKRGLLFSMMFLISPLINRLVIMYLMS